MRILATVQSEGFTTVIREDALKRVYYIADADIDADGANGQNGGVPAYRTDNRGSEDLANGGMAVRGGRVVGVASWFTDIVLLTDEGMPRVFPGGVIASRTSYRFPDKKRDDPSAYVDSETIPYAVVPPAVIERTTGAVLGCRVVCTHINTGKWFEGVVADAGPRNKVGEISIEAARRLGVNPSPRNGGEDRPLIQYEIWPGVPAKVNGVTFALQRSNGTYILP